MQPKETLIRNLEAEIDALEGHAYEPFQNEPGKRLFVQTLFVLLCAAVGAGAAAGIAWLFTKLDGQTFTSLGITIVIILPFIFAATAIWAIVSSSRKYRRYRAFSQELRELQQGTHDQEFVTGTPDINELNDMERWILGKPEATVDQLMAHPQSRVLVLPWWQLIGLPAWHLPAVFIGTFALNACFVLLPLPVYPFAAVIFFAVAPIPSIIVFLRWRMFRATSYINDPQPTLFSVLTSQSNASFYQHWLVLHRLKTKGLVDPQRMEPFEDGFPTTKYLFSVFYPLAAVLPIEVLTVNSTKLTVACNRLSEG